MIIFNSLKIYAEKWVLKNSRDFTQEEIELVSEAVVVPSEYGNSIQFNLKEGGIVFIPVSKESAVGVGEVIDLTKAKLITLARQGDSDIVRVEI